jgi:hypothetical protein
LKQPDAGATSCLVQRGVFAGNGIRPRVAERISFDEVAEAHRRLAGGLEGKFVLCRRGNRAAAIGDANTGWFFHDRNFASRIVESGRTSFVIL